MVVRCWLKKNRHGGNCSASRDLQSDAEQLPEWWNFQFEQKKHYGFFFLHTHFDDYWDFNMCCFISCTLKKKKKLHFSVKKSSVRLLSYRLTSKRLAENDVKTSKSSCWRHALESSYILHVIRHFLAPVGFTEIPVGYARILFLTWRSSFWIRIHCRHSYVDIHYLFKSIIHFVSEVFQHSKLYRYSTEQYR